MRNKNIDSQDNQLVKTAVIIGDLIILNLIFWFFQYVFKLRNEDVHTIYQSMIANSVIYIACTMRNGVVLYRPQIRKHQIGMRVLNNMVMFVIVQVILFQLGGFFRYEKLTMCLYWLLMTVCIYLFRITVLYFLKLVRVRISQHNKSILVGGNDIITRLYTELSSVADVGSTVAGYFYDHPIEKLPAACPYLGTPSDIVAYLASHPETRRLYCSLPSSREDEIMVLIDYCTNNLVHFYSVPNVSNYLHHRVHLNMIGSVPYLSLYREPLSRPENRLLKRAFDICFSLLFLCTLFPIVLIIVSIITKLTMPGPIFFRQKRNGINGREFYCLKFRSMRVNDQADTLQATKDDPRKTRWGEIMRKMSIDELPQFVNVLLGDMSVVGPRPHMTKHTETYSKMITGYMVRHYIKPGITGWSQVTGFRGETRELSQMEGRIRGDIWYIENWSFWLDLYIIYKTVANAVMGDEAAY